METLHVLCVEDNAIDRLAIERMVKSKGLPYEIEVAGTIAEARNLFMRNHYDVILLDYLLPDGTGLALLKMIKEVPVIFVTESGEATIAAQAMKGGAYDYLIKDPDRDYLELLPATIDKVMRIFLMEQGRKRDAEVNAELSKMYEEAKELSLHDALTGLANRRLMTIDLERNIARAERGGTPLSVLMVDIDYFKTYNDTHGHQAGDTLLAVMGKALAEGVRRTDLVARYGGEEFLVLLFDTDLSGACLVAERIRNTVSDRLGITVSIGVASYRRGQKIAKFLGNADAALYHAKQKGRNRVEVSPSVITIGDSVN